MPPLKNAKKAQPVKAKIERKPISAQKPLRAPNIQLRVLDATYEQVINTFEEDEAKPGDRVMDLNVSWSPAQVSHNQNIFIQFKIRVVVAKKLSKALQCVAEISAIAKAQERIGKGLGYASTDVMSILQATWPQVRPHMASLLALGSHQPPLPVKLPATSE